MPQFQGRVSGQNFKGSLLGPNFRFQFNLYFFSKFLTIMARLTSRPLRTCARYNSMESKSVLQLTETTLNDSCGLLAEPRFKFAPSVKNFCEKYQEYLMVTYKPCVAENRKFRSLRLGRIKTKCKNLLKMWAE